MKPISPKEAEDKRIEAIAPQMVQAVNELIVENLVGNSSKVLQKDIVARYLKITNGEKMSKSELHEKNQLDFESIFEKSGWKVEYEKPIYYAGEDFEAYFKFTKKRVRKKNG